MEFLEIIIYSNLVTWFLVPIRQYRTRFFTFFFVLALFDPIAIIAFYIASINIQQVYIVGTIIIFYVVLFDIRNEIKIGAITLLVLASIFVVFFSQINVRVIHLLVHIIILIQFLKFLIKYFSAKRRILLFHIVLIVYEASILIKYFIIITEAEIGPVYFYTTTLIQIFIGIFFLFVNEKNSTSIKV